MASRIKNACLFHDMASSAYYGPGKRPVNAESSISSIEKPNGIHARPCVGADSSYYNKIQAIRERLHAHGDAMAAIS